MLTNINRVLNERVNQVFDTRPRDGAKAPMWLPRPKMEDHFNDLLYQSGAHICVDGPSGTGKSSLVKTQLSKENKKVIAVQITSKMDWTDLCREIIGDITKTDSNFSIEMLLGIRADLIPNASVKLGYRRKSRGTNELKQWKAVGSLINESDLCRALQASGSVLYIDDFEKADRDLVTRVADTCKLMTQSFSGKIVIVGTGDIYYRIMSTEPALESRLLSLSVGALPSADDAWQFLCRGFDALHISHPQQQYDKGKVKYDRLLECKIAVDDAAGGLPKALNEFGRRISLTKISGGAIALSDMEDIAKKTVYEKIDEYGKQFPKLEELLVSKLELRLLLGAIYRRKIGTILNSEDIFRDCQNQLSRDQFEDAIHDLVEAKIITQTGKNRETLFISNLYLAHIFGVCANKHSQYGLDPRLYGSLGQLSLPLNAVV
jgi:AAA domain